MDSKKTGMIAIIGCSLMWAVEAVFVKKAYASAEVLQTAAIRVAVASMTALIYILLKKILLLRLLKKNFRRCSTLPW